MIRWWIRVPKQRKIKKQKRTRRQYHWELIQFDWSYHNWFEDWVERCLLLAIDGDMFDEEKLTRFSQAMGKLWVLVIYANTPEAKWRVERSFRTHQDRLVKKLRLAWIKSVTKANSYLKDTYISEHNKKYSIKAVSNKDLHVPLSNQEKTNFYWYFAKESIRKIRRDGTIHYNNKVYQIKKPETTLWLIQSYYSWISYMRSWNLLMKS